MLQQYNLTSHLLSEEARAPHEANLMGVYDLLLAMNEPTSHLNVNKGYVFNTVTQEKRPELFLAKHNIDTYEMAPDQMMKLCYEKGWCDDTSISRKQRVFEDLCIDETVD